ncbi:MAG: restriction endonuclease [Chloroflexi bacterium]|nr:restriction endonuclease [Chloroflexota bacterium]
MAIPGFQSLMLPLLSIAADGNEHTLGDAVEILAAQLGLSNDERREIIPSGQLKLENRVGWARTYLKKAGLLESTGRARFRIAQRGIEVLGNKPTGITVEFLKQFAEVREFLGTSTQGNKNDNEVTDLKQTPQEILDLSYQHLRHAVAQDILERARKCSPRRFEQIVVDLLVAMGYGGSRKDAGQAVGQSGDGGIDGIIKEDRLGLDIVYIQAKRWESTVGRPLVQAFAGSLEGQRARKGVLITTSQFSLEAREYVGRIEKKIVLIDGEELAQLMIDHNIGVSELATYVVKKIDSDYFGGEL